MGRGADSPGLTKKQTETVDKYQKKESLTDKQGEELVRLIAKRDYKPEFDLSQGAKTHIRNKVKGVVFGTKKVLENKYLSKGIMVEDDSIELYNEVHFTKYTKNPDSNNKSNKWLKGTCDVDTGKKRNLVIDIKSPWSLETFPVLPDEIDLGVYEWQLRGYMMLYDRDFAELAYCMVDTPDSLLDYEKNLTIHHVSHIEPELRITKLCFDRCQEKEDLIKYKVTEARKYANWYAEQIAKKYG
jgi:hypothetical protein